MATFTTFFLIMLTFLSFLFLETLTSQLINSFSAFCNTTMPLAFLPYLRVSSLYIHIILTPYTPFSCQDLCTFSAIPFLLMHCNFVIYVWSLLHTLLRPCYLNLDIIQPSQLFMSLRFYSILASLLYYCYDTYVFFICFFFSFRLYVSFYCTISDIFLPLFDTVISVFLHISRNYNYSLRHITTGP